MLSSLSEIFINAISGILVALIATILGKWISDKNQARKITTVLLDVAKKQILPTSPSVIRASIFLLEDKRNKSILINRFQSSSTNFAPEKNLRLEKYQGVAGHAWGYGNTVLADLSIAESLGASWNLTDQQRKLTSGLKSILATPIFHPKEKDKIIGVLTFESEDNLVELFEQEKSLETIQNTAAVAATLLLGLNVI